MRCIEERRSFESRLFAATMTDTLTGLTNRRAFVAMLRHLVAHGARGSVAMFDIDHFRALNLRHGQSAGDEVLAGFAQLLRTLTRPDDIISRVGGESFAVLMPDTTPEQAGSAVPRDRRDAGRDRRITAGDTRARSPPAPGSRGSPKRSTRRSRRPNWR